MGRFQEFADVLASRLRQEIAASASSENLEKTAKSPLFPSENELFPSGMAWLMGQIERHETAPDASTKTAHRAYGVKAKPRRPHILDARQTEAYHFLKTYSPNLPAGFNLSELKRAYRQAALRVHPDQGGNAALFRELRAALLALQPLVTLKKENP